MQFLSIKTQIISLVLFGFSMVNVEASTSQNPFSKWEGLFSVEAKTKVLSWDGYIKVDNKGLVAIDLNVKGLEEKTSIQPHRYAPKKFGQLDIIDKTANVAILTFPEPHPMKITVQAKVDETGVIQEIFPEWPLPYPNPESTVKIIRVNPAHIKNLKKPN